MSSRILIFLISIITFLILLYLDDYFSIYFRDFLLESYYLDLIINFLFFELEIILIIEVKYFFLTLIALLFYAILLIVEKKIKIDFFLHFKLQIFL